MRISVIIVSADSGVIELCREIIAEYFDITWDLTVCSEPATAAQECDIYLCDISTGARLPECTGWGQTHFVLLRRTDVAEFCQQHAEAAASILLKPVTRPTLRAIFSSVIGAKQAKETEAVKSLRVDRDELLQCLIQANLRLQEYDQERTNFLSRAVHDFRAPVTALSGYCGLLLQEQLGPLTTQQREVLERMLKSAKRLARMSNAMFQLSVSRHINQRPDVKPADIRECVEQALHEITQFMEEKHIEPFVDMSPPAGALLFEPGQIEQVVINLLDNACKFTPRNGWIEIRGYPYFWDRRVQHIGRKVDRERRFRAVQHLNAYRIDIQDSGPGIPHEYLDGIFEEYTSYAGREGRSGAGLGLAICKMIVSQHFGKIWAESRPVGATFSFVLPVADEMFDEAMNPAAVAHVAARSI
jgi:signal transduction histidine kinase